MPLSEYLERELQRFESDPADSDYQRGFEACLRELQKALERGDIK